MTDKGSQHELQWSFVGEVAYGEAQKLQSQIREQVQSGDRPDTLLLLEHPHVYTLGRNADRGDILVDSNWLQSHGVEVADCDRGGQVTYHGPGQLIGYPIIDLNPNRRDIRQYVQDLRAVLVAVLDEIGIQAASNRKEDEIGVWVGEKKIASIGVHISRWVTTHGFALNVATDLDYFSAIVPCGLPTVQMTSVKALTDRRVSLSEVASLCVEHFCDRFELRPVKIPPTQLDIEWSIAS